MNNTKKERINLEIKKIDKSDLKEALEVIKEVFNASDEKHAIKDVIFDVKLSENKLEQGIHYWIGVLENETVGIVGLEENLEKCFWLSWFGVRKEYRGKGIGLKMLDFAYEEAKRRGAKKLCIQCGSLPMFQRANHMYEEFGFHKEFRIKDYWEEHDDLIVMEMDMKR